MEDKTLDAKIGVEKGLLPEGGTNGLAEKIELSASIPSPYVLTIGEVTTEHDGETGTIRVQTSQQIIDPTSQPPSPSVPAVKFTAEPSEDGFRHP
jgi:hypothetical protein